MCVSVCEVCVSGSSAGEQLLARVLARCAASVSPPHRPLASLVTASVSPSCSLTHGDGRGRVLGKCVVNVNTV